MKTKPREKFLNSALKLFNEKWFENTSTALICSDAWYTSWAMFFHFKTKNELLDQLYISIKKKSSEFILKNLDENLWVKEKIRKILKLWFEYYLNNYEEFVFMKSFSESRHISRIAKEEINREVKIFYKILDEWKTQWIFINEENSFIHTWINWMLYYFVEYLKNNKKTSIEKCLNFIMRSILLNKII